MDNKQFTHIAVASKNIKKQKKISYPDTPLDLSNKSITLMLVSDYRINDSVNSFKHCMKMAKFSEYKFLTSNTEHNIFSDLKNNSVEIVKINKLNSIQDYSHFMVHELNNFINTDFVLIIQYDGFIINPNSWTNEFLKYDYIGAPWNPNSVGNGGFSLRSKRIINEIYNMRDGLKNWFHPEDVVYCHENHLNHFKNLGIKHAPFSLAQRFSHESFGASVAPFVVHGKGYFRRYLKN